MNTLIKISIVCGSILLLNSCLSAISVKCNNCEHAKTPNKIGETSKSADVRFNDIEIIVDNSSMGVKYDFLRFCF